jgi:peptidyl-prolyl cis-trans isomerase C
VTGVPIAPTALPLPEATGEYSSTEVIAQVGTGAVTRGDFVRFYKPGGDPAETLNQLIQIELVMQEASSEGVAADADAVTKQIADIKAQQAAGDPAQFIAFLDHAKVGSEENLRRLLERDYVVEQMVLRHTSAEQAHARHILLSTEATTDTAKIEAVKVEAEALLKDLDGGADFAALAAEHSDDTGSKEAGGDLGWAPRGLFVDVFDEAVFSMKVGERRLVQSQFGWHIIELLDAPEVRVFESTQILQSPPGQQAFAETFIPWITELQKQAEAAKQIKIVIPAEQLVTAPAGS